MRRTGKPSDPPEAGKRRANSYPVARLTRRITAVAGSVINSGNRSTATLGVFDVRMTIGIHPCNSPVKRSEIGIGELPVRRRTQRFVAVHNGQTRLDVETKLEHAEKAVQPKG